MREKLALLFLASFGRAIQPNYLDWRYVENGQQQLLFSLEMVDRDPVASYSAFPVDLICDGQTCRTAISMTTMTHPQWRGKGLFPKLATELYTQLGVLQIAAIWGFPNANSHPVFNDKLVWANIYEIPTMTLDVTKVDARKFSLDVVVGSDDDFSLDYPESPKDGLIRINRSKGYLAWRYARNPINIYQNHVISHEGKVSSYVVTKLFSDGIDLVDIQPANSEEARVLLSHVVKQGIDQGVKHLYCWAPTHHSVHAVLERIGFVNAAPVTYFGGRELIPGMMPGAWLGYRKWYVQMGDSDVY